MGRFDGVLLVSDFDDTLVNRAKEIPTRTQEALRWFTENGGKFTLASGRSILGIAPQVAQVPVNAPVVCANGTQLYDFREQRLLAETLLPESAREDFKAVMAAFPKAAVEIYGAGQLYCTNPNLVTTEHLRITGQTALKRPLSEIPFPWIYAKFEEETTYLSEMQGYLRKNFPDRYEAIFSNPYLLEIEASGCGKGTGVLQLAELLGIGRQHIYCAGDQENDVSMLKVAALGFVPENSTEKAINAADRIVCDCDEGSIADVVEELGAIYPEK